MSATRAFSYLRFSTPEQQQGDSQRRQTERAREYAERHALELDTKLTFQDLGVSAYSGRNVSSGAFAAFLEAVKTGLVPSGSVLLVENLDRVSRAGWWEALPVLQQIINAGVEIVTLTNERRYTLETMRTDPMAGMEMMFTLFRAHDESRVKADRLSRVWEAKRKTATSKPLTSRVPGWLKLEDGKFKRLAERVAIVRRIFSEALRGKGQNTIAEDLNRDKVPVFGRGTRWHRSYIVKLLTNPSVYGVMIPHRAIRTGGKRRREPLEPIAGYYPPILEKELFDRVQTLRSSASPSRGRHARQPVQNVFGGLAKCPVCGDTMQRMNKTEGFVYLVCSKARAGAGCKYRTVRYKDVEDAFLRDAPALLAEVPAAGEAGEVLEGKVQNTQAALLSLVGQIENLVDAISKSGGSALLVDRLRELEEEQVRLKQDETALLHERDELAGPVVAHKVEELRAALQGKPIDRTLVNVLLRQLVSKVTVDYITGQLELHWRHNGVSSIVFAWPKRRRKTQST